MIEKIYTEQSEESPFVTSFIETNTNSTAVGSKSSPKHLSSAKSVPSVVAAPATKSKPMVRGNTTTGCALVVTKTSPLVMAELNCDEEDDEAQLAVVKRPPQPPSSAARYPQPSLIDTGKHEIIKQVSESMDHLRNELLQKGDHLILDLNDLYSINA